MQSHFTERIINLLRSVTDKKNAPWILILFLVANYILFFHFLYRALGWWAISFAWSYIGLSIWFWGLKGGLLAHIFVIFLNIFLLKTIGAELAGGPVPTIFSLLLVVVLGRLRDLSLKLREELNWRKKHVETLLKAHDDLERQVAERTSDLKSTVDKLKYEATERKQTEEALKESERFSSSLMEHSPTPILVLNSDTSIRYVNPAFEKLTGYSSVEIEDKLVPYPWWIEDSQSGDVDERKEAIFKGTPKREKLFRKRTGEDFWVETTSTPIKQNGELRYALTTWIDITERKQAEEELRESEERYRLLIENIPSVTWITSEKGETSFISKNVEEIYGYSQHEIYEGGDSTWFDRIHPDDVEMVKESFLSIFSKDKKFDIEYRIQKKDGEWIWVHDMAFNTYEKDNIRYVYGTFYDISERKLADKLLQESEAKYRELVENINDVIYTTDETGMITYISPAIEAVSGYKPREIIGKSFTNYINEVDLPEISKRFQQVLQGIIESYEYFEYRIIRKSGEICWVRTSSRPILKEGHTFGLRGVMVDITERKNLEAQIAQAQRMESIGTLAGGIAHDFNNILSAIIGYTELLKMQLPEGNDVFLKLEEIFRAGNRAKDLVQQILTFSRQTDQELKPVQVSIIVKEVLKLLRASLPTTIDIRRKIHSDSMVLGDATQIHQILMNLCTNAGFVMRENGGVLEVRLENIDLDPDSAAIHTDLDSGSYLKLTVSDTGYGMTPEVLKQIFDPFFTTKEKGEGTGMGLSVVHGIVKSYGGAIYAHSEPEKGSRFEVFLPVIEKRIESETKIEELTPKGREHILFIDDEQFLVEISKELLESLGYKVTTRTSSIEALELFNTQPSKFDLVITDITMPQMTGDKLAKKLMEIRPDIPVILCTGFSARISPEKSKDMGIKGYIMKPPVLRDLANTVRKVLDEK